MINDIGRNCGKCGEFKDWPHYNKNPKGARGYKSICKVCHLENARNLRDSRDPEELAFKRHEKKLGTYGINHSDYLSMLEKQGGVCAICDSPPTDKYLCVDHCHTSGRVRGLLCSNCNSGLGKLGDNIEGLRKAMKYLEKEYG